MTESPNLPPPSRRQDVIEVLHGQQVVDPFRWLEDGDNAETDAWVDAQNAFTRSCLDSLPGRAAIAERLAEVLAIGDISSPAPRGARQFFLRRDGSENHPRLLLREEGGEAQRELINPNALDAGGLVSLDWWYPSPDGALVAYGLSIGGDEQSTLRVLQVESGIDLPDTIPNTRAASVAWLADSSGFYYTRYPATGDVPPGQEFYYRRVFLHRLWADPITDQLVFGEGRAAEDWPSVQLSPDGRHLLVTVNRGWDATDCYVRDEQRDAFAAVTEGEPSLSHGEIVDGTLYLRTNLGAPNYRLVAIDAEEPGRRPWQELIPERPNAVLEQVQVIGGRLMLVYLEDASSRLECAALDGSDLRRVRLPSIGTIHELRGEWSAANAFFGFSSFAIPPSVYCYNTLDGTVSLWAAVEATEQTDPVEVDRKRCFSKDGTVVPIFVVHRQGLVRNGDNPTVLTGYGGFNISMTPAFSRSLRFWSSGAESTRWPTCAVAANSGRNGTEPVCWRISRTSLTTSSPRPSTCAPRVIPAPRDSRSLEGATAGCWSARQ
jgi:prolyl oligopeptidase